MLISYLRLHAIKLTQAHSLMAVFLGQRCLRNQQGSQFQSVQHMGLGTEALSSSPVT